MIHSPQREIMITTRVANEGDTEWRLQVRGERKKAKGINPRFSLGDCRISPQWVTKQRTIQNKRVVLARGEDIKNKSALESLCLLYMHVVD